MYNYRISLILSIINGIQNITYSVVLVSKKLYNFANKILYKSFCNL